MALIWAKEPVRRWTAVRRIRLFSLSAPGIAAMGRRLAPKPGHLPLVDMLEMDQRLGGTPAP